METNNLNSLDVVINKNKSVSIEEKENVEQSTISQVIDEKNTNGTAQGDEHNFHDSDEDDDPIYFNMDRVYRKTHMFPERFRKTSSSPCSDPSALTQSSESPSELKDEGKLPDLIQISKEKTKTEMALLVQRYFEEEDEYYERREEIHCERARLRAEYKKVKAKQNEKYRIEKMKLIKKIIKRYKK